MATAKSIGSLFVDIEARTANLEKGMAKVQNILEDTNKVVKSQADAWGQTTNAIEGKVARFGFMLLGARTGVMLLAKEFRYVTENIEKIPGVPLEVMRSVQELRHNMVQSQNEFRLGIAYAESWFNTAAKAMGATAALIAGTNFFGNGPSKDMLDAWKDTVTGTANLTPDMLARDRDPNFDEKLAKSKELLAERTEQAARAAMDEAHQIIALRAARLNDLLLSTDASKNSLEQNAEELKAKRDLEEENTKWESMQKRLAAAEDQVTLSIGKGQTATLSKREAVEAYREQLTKAWVALQQINAAIRVDPKDPLLLEQKIKATEAQARAQRGLNEALRRYGELSVEMGKATADDLQEAVLKGENLHELLNKLAGDLLRIILQREIFGPMADFLGGGFKALFGVPASASGGPFGAGPRLVGEFGPEVVNFGAGGTIIPNDKLGGGSSGNNFYIDATGADPAAIARLERSLVALAGPGVVERRAVAATINANWRGGGVGRALQGA